jgi:hypothetical protein
MFLRKDSLCRCGVVSATAVGRAQARHTLHPRLKTAIQVELVRDSANTRVQTGNDDKPRSVVKPDLFKGVRMRSKSHRARKQVG